MSRPRTVYRGNRKYSWIITLAVFVLVVLLLVAVWLFYYLQRYLVYDKDEVRLVLPADRAQAPEPDSGGPAAAPGAAEVEIIVDPADFSDVSTSAGKGLTPVRALFVAAEDVKQETLDFYAAGIGDFNAVVLELQGPDGLLRYRSGVPYADSYGVNGTLELAEPLEKLKAQGIRLVAQLSGMTDGIMAVRNAPIALRDARSGEIYHDAAGKGWLDPYSEPLRAYLTDLLRDLHALGFDEVLFSGLSFPAGRELRFSQVMTETPDRVSAVSSLARYLRAQAEDIGIALSATIEAGPLAAGESGTVGQDAAMFFKVFDRVVYDTADGDPAACHAALTAALGGGDADTRIVPIAEDYAPEHASYIVR